MRRQRLSCITIVAMVATAELTSMAHVQDVMRGRLVIDVDESRPLSAAARQLEQQLGIAVTYEDGSYVAPGDIVDVTEQVRRDGRMDLRVYGMRGGAFRFERALTVGGRASDTRQVLDELVATWNRSGIGGAFSLV